MLQNEINSSKDGRKDPSVAPSTLGMKWDIEKDLLLFSEHSLTIEKKNFTKRTELSLTSKLFDPLGILTPITIMARKLMQKNWKMEIFWDDVIDNDSLLNDMKLNLEDINKAKCLKLDRRLNLEDSITVHVFSDASQEA